MSFVLGRKQENVGVKSAFLSPSCSAWEPKQGMALSTFKAGHLYW